MKKKNLSIKLLVVGIIIVIVSLVGFVIYNLSLKPAMEERCVLEGELCGYDYGECCGDLHCHPTALNSAGKMYGICGVGSNDRTEGEICGAEYLGCCGEGLICLKSNIPNEGVCFDAISGAGFETINEGKCF